MITRQTFFLTFLVSSGFYGELIWGKKSWQGRRSRFCGYGLWVNEWEGRRIHKSQRSGHVWNWEIWVMGQHQNRYNGPTSEMRSEFAFRRGRNIDNISGFSRPKMEKGMNTVHGLWRQRVHKVFWVSCGQTQMVVQRWKLQWLCWEPSYEEWSKHGRTFLKWGCWDSVQSNIIKERLVCYDVFLMLCTLR